MSWKTETERERLIGKLADEMDPDGAREFIDRVILEAVNWRPIETAPHDGTAILGYGRHVGSPPDAQRGVKAGDHWWSIMLWDIWRGGAWVFAKDGTKVWSDPTHWMPLPEPPV